MPGLRYRLSTQLKGTGSRYRTQTSSGVWLQTPDERKTKFQKFNWSLRLIREHKVRWYTMSRFGKVQQGRTAFLLCPTSDWLKTKNRHTNKHKNQQIKQKQRQNKQRENFKLLLQQQFSVPLRMSVHRQWVKRDLGLLPTSTVHVCCHGKPRFAQIAPRTT